MTSLQALWGRWRYTHLLRLACLFTVHVGRGLFCPLWWSFPHDSHCYKLSPLQGCWAGAATPAFSDLFIYSLCEGVPLPHSLELREPHPLCSVSFFFQLLFYYLVYFFLFSLGVGQSVLGAMLVYPREYCMPLICSPDGLPSRLESGIWQQSSHLGSSI
jgi:hypothetical protein